MIYMINERAVKPPLNPVNLVNPVSFFVPYLTQPRRSDFNDLFLSSAYELDWPSSYHS